MKITPDHLERGAFIYIRQSTADQLANNHESRRRQYGLAERARTLGWTDVTVIDDDLGRSGSGVSRPGFERLLAAICEGRVGAVFAIEASRLARNGRDWHTLIEFCGLSRPPANGRWNGLFAVSEVCGGQHAGKIEAYG
jgi:DNA invertase Pin-like site-specific DNA recombinase